VAIRHTVPHVQYGKDYHCNDDHAGHYRKRVLHKLARDLGLPKLTFQVIRRTIATLAQKKGTVKDVQGILRHSRTATTTDV
jgi:integrase